MLEDGEYTGISQDEIVMTFWVVYDSPDDFPGRFVLRRHHVVHGFLEPQVEQNEIVADSLDEIHAHIPAGLVRSPRWPNDPYMMLEFWMTPAEMAVVTALLEMYA